MKKNRLKLYIYLYKKKKKVKNMFGDVITILSSNRNVSMNKNLAMEYLDLTTDNINDIFITESSNFSLPDINATAELDPFYFYEVSQMNIIY